MPLGISSRRTRMHRVTSKRKLTASVNNLLRTGKRVNISSANAIIKIISTVSAME
jgi:hypothetical protein